MNNNITKEPESKNTNLKYILILSAGLLKLILCTVSYFAYYEVPEKINKIFEAYWTFNLFSCIFTLYIGIPVAVSVTLFVFAVRDYRSKTNKNVFLYFLFGTLIWAAASYAQIQFLSLGF